MKHDSFLQCCINDGATIFYQANIWVNVFLCNGDYARKFNVVFAVTVARKPLFEVKDGPP